MPVGLVKRVMTTKGRRFCPVVVAGNGRVSSDRVIVNGHETRHPDGTFYIEWWEGSVRNRKAVGTDATQAQAQRLRKQAQLNAKETGLELKEDSPRRSVADACAVYLDDIKMVKKRSTWNSYRLTLEYFQESCSKAYLEEIDKRDLIRYVAYLREEKELADITVFNKFKNVVIFLKSQSVGGFVNKQDWPRFSLEDPETYEKEEIERLLAVAGSEHLLINFLLMTGCREKEAVYMTWPDIDFKNATVSVREKKQYGWTPKNYKGREIQVPDCLIEELRIAKSRAPKECSLIFFEESCVPRRNMLRSIKRTAVLAGIDPDTVWLHKFRSTFSTEHLQNGVDIRTVQRWLGHTDMKSTMRYLKPARNADMRDKVNATFG